MNTSTDMNERWAGAMLRGKGRIVPTVIALSGVLLLLSSSVFADEPTTAPESRQLQLASMSRMEDQSEGMGSPSSKQTDSIDMNSNDMGTMEMGTKTSDSKDMGSMDMSSMQGGSAPSNARDPNVYSDSYEYTGMPGMEKADQIVVGKLLVDQLEFVHGDSGDGVAWDAYASYGGDNNKLWLRSEGGVVNGKADETTSAEALWWRAYTPFWGTLLGLREDFGPGSHTYLAFGVEGLAPYWFDLQATGYVAEDGRFSARLKGSYDLLFTNRLILTPEAESNLYSRADSRRGVGAGVGNIELALRLRYEFSRKFAPYAGFDWDRALGETADRRRIEGEPVSDARFVTGLRLWW